MIEVKCDWCGESLRRFPSLVHPKNYCNRSCQGKYRSAHYTGTRAAHWKGGTSRDRQRVLWHLPWHHRADDGGYVERSVIVAELKLQRSLTPEEVVHHDDENPANDHPDNLIVCANQAEHARIHGLKQSREHMMKMREARGKIQR